MTPLGDRIIPVEPSRANPRYTPAEAVNTYRATLRPFEVASDNQSGSLNVNLGASSSVSRPHRAVWTRSTPEEAEPRVVTVLGPAPLDPILSEARKALRKAIALRPVIETNELPAAYTHAATRVFSLQNEVQSEDARLRAEGVTETRQWLA